MAKSLQSSSVGLIIRQKEPTNLETPFDQVDSFLTPMELFYIRSHFPTPKLELASYQLRIDGAVRKPFCLSYKELRDMPSETRIATLECAGNSRVFLPIRSRTPRAIVPGQYGMASVKWLTHIHALREPFRGYRQTADYAYWDHLDGKPVRRALGEMKVKSEISRPSVYEILGANQVYTIFGAAWSRPHRCDAFGSHATEGEEPCL